MMAPHRYQVTAAGDAKFKRLHLPLSHLRCLLACLFASTRSWCTSGELSESRLTIYCNEAEGGGRCGKLKIIIDWLKGKKSEYVKWFYSKSESNHLFLGSSVPSYIYYLWIIKANRKPPLVWTGLCFISHLFAFMPHSASLCSISAFTFCLFAFCKRLWPP